MLRRRFSAVWIAENASDLMAQANVEYAEWLEDNPPARNPVGWLLTCAYRRAQNLLDAETRKPSTAPLDSVFHLADESTPTPEQQALDHERGERLRRALGHLPEKECKLLALVYYGDHSIREAGRKLGWQKSAADKHHKRALEKLEALVGDRSLLSPAGLGWAAWAVAYGRGHRLARAIDRALEPGREALARAVEAAGWVGRQLGDAGRRLAPLSDHASAVASSGPARLVGACGVTAASVVCGLAVSGVVPAGGVAVHAATPAKGRARPARSQPAARGPGGLSAPQLVIPEADTSSATEEASRTTTTAPKATSRKRKAPPATTEQTINEFGVEAGAVQSSGSTATTESSSSGSTGSSSSGSSSSGTKPTPPGVEFGP